VEQCDVWRAADRHLVGVHEWLAGERCRNIEQVVKDTQALEADNERRTVRLIKELSAPVNLDEYCQQANSYLHFHNIMLEERKWFTKERGPYQSPDIWPLFNTTIDSTFKTSAAQRKALLTCI
jgi:hypothetical protein